MDEDKAFEAGWEYRVVHKAYEAMLNTDLALKQIIQLFDSDGDGLVSPQEFKQAMQVLQSSRFPPRARKHANQPLAIESHKWTDSRGRLQMLVFQRRRSTPSCA